MRSIPRLDRRQVHVYGNLGGAAGDKGAVRTNERLDLFADAPDGPETKGEKRGSARVIIGDLFMETRYSDQVRRRKERVREKWEIPLLSRQERPFARLIAIVH